MGNSAPAWQKVSFLKYYFLPASLSVFSSDQFHLVAASGVPHRSGKQTFHQESVLLLSNRGHLSIPFNHNSESTTQSFKVRWVTDLCKPPASRPLHSLCAGIVDFIVTVVASADNSRKIVIFSEFSRANFIQLWFVDLSSPHKVIMESATSHPFADDDMVSAQILFDFSSLGLFPFIAVKTFVISIELYTCENPKQRHTRQTMHAMQSIETKALQVLALCLCTEFLHKKYPANVCGCLIPDSSSWHPASLSERKCKQQCGMP
jgi:hypothetical protein